MSLVQNTQSHQNMHTQTVPLNTAWLTHNYPFLRKIYPVLLWKDEVRQFKLGMHIGRDKHDSGDELLSTRPWLGSCENWKLWDCCTSLKQMKLGSSYLAYLVTTASTVVINRYYMQTRDNKVFRCPVATTLLDGHNSFCIPTTLWAAQSDINITQSSRVQRVAKSESS